MEYALQPSSIGSVRQASPRKQRSHVQPASGPEKAFGQALRELRTRRGTSQEPLALDAGFDRTYVNLIERGISSPTIRAVCRIGEVLKYKPSEFVKRMEAIMGKETEVRGAGPKHVPTGKPKGRSPKGPPPYAPPI